MTQGSDLTPQDPAGAGGHQDDPARRRRLRWRCRRGLLENDILLTRFLDRYEQDLTDDEVAGLDQLLDLPDNELLDLLLGRRDPAADEAGPEALRVLQLLRAV